MSTAEQIQQRRLDRMRNGKGSCEIVNLISDPEIMIALVPLTEGEFDAAQQEATKTHPPEDYAQIGLFEREFRRQIVFRAAREHNDLSKPVWENMADIRNALDHGDIDHLWDEYMTFTSNSSPSIENMSEEDLEELKKALFEAEWKGLSGKSWWLLKRFLGSLSIRQRQGRLPGLTS